MKLIRKHSTVAQSALPRFKLHVQTALDAIEQAGKLLDGANEAQREQMFDLLDQISDRTEALKYILDPTC
jgi:hypothetical protein